MNSRNIAFLSVFAAIAFFGGVVQQFALRTPSLLLQSGIPVGLIALAMIFAWYRRDANERGYRRSLGLNVMMMATAIVTLPYYLFRTRGFSRGIAGTFLFLAGLLGYAAIDGAGHWLALYLETRP